MKKLLSIMAAGAATTGANAATLEGKSTPSEVLEQSAPSDWRVLDPENTLYIELETGRAVVALSTQLAPAHVAQVKALAREGFYDGLSFYRVIDGFVAQGGDVFETREIRNAAKSMNAEFEQPLTDEIDFDPIKDADGFAATVGFVASIPAGVDAKGENIWHLHCTGAFAFGRNNEPDTASTEFYIALQPQRYLDRNMTVFGRVVEGMEHIQTLRRVSPPEDETDDAGEQIVSIRVAADAPAEAYQPLEVLDSSTETFRKYLEARRNRPGAFFHFRHDYLDICQTPIPVRPVAKE